MALPELFANSPTPGSVVALTTLGAAQSSTSSLSFTMAAAAPAALQASGSGQFRAVIDSEIVLFDATQCSTTTWTALQRGAEGSTAATHASGASVFHYLTAGALADLVMSPLYGDGADGNVTISGTTTLTRDMQYNNLTVSGTLNTGGFRVMVRGQLAGAGTIQFAAAAGGAAGSHPTTPSGFYGATGGGGSSTAAGSAGGDPGFANQLGGQGGAGGAGSGGSGGSTTTNGIGTASSGVALTNVAALHPHQLFGGGHFLAGSAGSYGGGSGGGGGGGDGSTPGGGGGQAGGVVAVFAFDSSLWTGSMLANGGSGGNATGTNCGGGGGGGGGFVALISHILPTGAYTLTATGGAGGAKTGTGVAGSAGSNGNTLAVVC